MIPIDINVNSYPPFDDFTCKTAPLPHVAEELHVTGNQKLSNREIQCLKGEENPDCNDILDVLENAVIKERTRNVKELLATAYKCEAVFLEQHQIDDSMIRRLLWIRSPIDVASMLSPPLKSDEDDFIEVEKKEIPTFDEVLSMHRRGIYLPEELLEQVKDT